MKTFSEKLYKVTSEDWEYARQEAMKNPNDSGRDLIARTLHQMLGFLGEKYSIEEMGGIKVSYKKGYDVILDDKKVEVKTGMLKEHDTHGPTCTWSKVVHDILDDNYYNKGKFERVLFMSVLKKEHNVFAVKPILSFSGHLLRNSVVCAWGKDRMQFQSTNRPHLCDAYF